MNKELLPCPFCGSPAFTDYEEITEEWYVDCSKDCCTFGPCYWEDEAVKGWNQRLPSHNKDYAKCAKEISELYFYDIESIETEIIAVLKKHFA